MFETVKRLYLSGKLSVIGVENAVAKGWISREEADRLIGMPMSLASLSKIEKQG